MSIKKETQLQLQVERELARRGRSGSAAQLACFSICLIATPILAEHTLPVSIFAAVMVSACATRLLLGHFHDRFYPARQAFWNSALGLATVTLGACWALLSVCTFTWYGMASTTNLLVCLTAAGMAAGGLSSLGPDKGKAIRYTVVLVGVPALFYITRFKWEVTWLGVGMALYLVFLLAQIRLISGEFKQLHLSRWLIEEDRARLQTVLDTIPGLVSWIGSDLRYRGVNKQLAHTLGISVDKIVGHRIGFLSPGSEFAETVGTFVRSSLDHDTRELRIVRAGEPQWHLLVMQKTSLDETYLIAIDIHDLKTAQSELETQRVKAGYAAKLASLGEMAAGIAHEINNPLAIISGSAQELELLSENGALNVQAVTDAAKRIEATVTRIANIIRGLRSFAREGGQDPVQPASLEKIVADTVELCGGRFKSHDIRLELPPIVGELFILCRPVQISQVLLNLLNNAFDAAEAAPEKWIRLMVEDLGQEVALSVVDSGPGVPKELRQRIMEPFFTTKEIGKGTGLGLSISKGLVEAHGGRLYLDETAPYTTFVIVIPKAEKTAALGSREAA